MTRPRTRFSTKLYIAAASFLGIVVVLASLFYLSIQRYQYQMQRNELAHNVLVSYLAVSDHTYRKLNAMGEIVMQTSVDDVSERFENKQLLRVAMTQVRQNIASEVAYVRDEDEGEELEHLVEIERLVEQIIRVSIRIRAAIQSDRLDDARRELSVVRSEAVAGRFSKLIDSALAEERREVSETEEAANRLDAFITTVLPMAVIVILVVGASMTVVVSRGLTRSFEALRSAASAYTSGDLEHHIGALREREFAELRDAFNHMAEELSARRAAVEQDKETLEALVSKRTQELEQSNTQLEHIDRSRRRLLADISHELRTPLTVIQGESEMALRGGTKSADEYQDALTRVREQTMHTSRLVDDLLFVARSEEAQARIEKRSVAVVGLIKAVCADFGVAAEKKRTSITQSYVDEHAVVFGDAGRLRQVFAILLDNAVRYSRTGSNIHVSLTRTENGLQISVKDNGIGLSEEDARQVFSRFYRGDNAERHAEGTGLGLPVAKAIIEAHKGRITLTGKPSEGAEAIVLLLEEDKIRAIA